MRPLRKKYEQPHRARPEVDAHVPLHVAVRACFTGLRSRSVYLRFRKILERYLTGDFRICHISIQTNHVHLLVEADSTMALSRGMQSFCIRAAKAINRLANRKGQVFTYRYCAKPILSGRQARNALVYVLNNFRKHKLDYRGAERTWQYDYFSSAISFPHWYPKLIKPPTYEPLPVAPPRTRLLISGWQGGFPYLRPELGPFTTDC